MSDSSAGAHLLERKSTVWFVALLVAVLFSVANLPWTLDEYDQAKQAFTSFEMVTEGQWLYQHTPKSRVATKPPLVGWVSAGVYGVTRNWEIAWRLPSFAAALLLGLALTRAARNAYGAAAGLIALAAFGLNLLSPRLATLVRTDMPLALATTLLGLIIWNKVRSGQHWTARNRLLVFALLTAAMLIKGPIIYAFLLPGIVAFNLWKRRGSSAVSAWCGSWPWIASLLVFLAWVAAGLAWMPGFYDQVVVREFLGRFGDTVHQSRAFLFYVPHLLHKFAPWSILGLALTALAWRTTRGTAREKFRNLPPDLAWLLCWSIGGLLVMSLIPSKRVDRIFPILPPLCLGLAAAVSALSKTAALWPRVLRWGTIAMLVTAVGMSVFVAVRVIGAYRRGDAALARFGADVRQDAAAHGWRYEARGWHDEALLVYLRRPRFLQPAEAVARWNAGALNALVIARNDLPPLLPQLSGATLARSVKWGTPEDGTREYVLLTRSSM